MAECYSLRRVIKSLHPEIAPAITRAHLAAICKTKSALMLLGGAATNLLGEYMRVYKFSPPPEHLIAEARGLTGTRIVGNNICGIIAVKIIEGVRAYRDSTFYLGPIAGFGTFRNYNTFSSHNLYNIDIPRESFTPCCILPCGLIAGCHTSGCVALLQLKYNGHGYTCLLHLTNTRFTPNTLWDDYGDPHQLTLELELGQYWCACTKIRLD